MCCVADRKARASESWVLMLYFDRKARQVVPKQLGCTHENVTHFLGSFLASGLEGC